MSDRFWSKVKPDGECWIWTGGQSNGTPGMFMQGNRSARAQRWAYKLTYGEIPARRSVKRTCASPMCVRPEHLTLIGSRGDISERFWDKVTKTDGCWVWNGSRQPFGHGTLHVGGRAGRHQLAHRISWELHYGAIPEGAYVLHRCDTPWCVRPDHLFTGSHADNQRDMKDKGRAAKGERKKGAKVTGNQVREIRNRYAGRKLDPNGRAWKNDPNSILVIAKDYGVAMETIFDIVKRRTWKHIE